MEKNITNVRQMLDKDKRVTCCQIVETLCLNATIIRAILKYHLHVKKLCFLWVLHSFTEDQKTRRVVKDTENT